MINPNQIDVIIVAACVSFVFFVIRRNQKKMDDSYEKLKNECDSKIGKEELKYLLALYLKPLIDDIKNLQTTMNTIIDIKVKKE